MATCFVLEDKPSCEMCWILRCSNAHWDSYNETIALDKPIKKNNIRSLLHKGQKRTLAGFCSGGVLKMGKGILQFFCPVLKVKLSRKGYHCQIVMFAIHTDNNNTHTYIFYLWSFDTGSYRFLSDEKNRVCGCTVVHTNVVHL